MAQPPSRSILAMILRNFINSLKPRQFSGTLIGKDYFGNQYYEIPANPSIGKRRASRWFDPPKKEDFMQEMPAEWEAWLRGRRKLPPTEEEVMKNLAIMQMKKKNAIEVDAKGGKMTPMTKGIETFPKRTEYETIPGRRDDKS
ncbi:NADH dehydrogenase [ubiquinone] 1 alpha subcomplex assembly factor 2 [Diabrotica virgifera virgifera]|uniref:NADH dehydrogenase [ubiquinone] 1 alpha subcomplex assembly factor 2 n=1 Tax=Diabrotica virgifera virgifera TaxID=50390 RepID=A0A6P7F446_DIAVI|nr:NADH dehydrogenase [ubiquinone] 1 alpha subcomplex assembly factor 2 [Diabrotica virgifera virgifera]